MPETSDHAVEIAGRLSQEHVADIVETLNEQAKTAPDIVAQLPLDRAIEVLDQPGLDAPADLVQALPRDRTVALLSGMSADRALHRSRKVSCR